MTALREPHQIKTSTYHGIAFTSSSRECQEIRGDRPRLGAAWGQTGAGPGAREGWGRTGKPPLQAVGPFSTASGARVSQVHKNVNGPQRLSVTYAPSSCLRNKSKVYVKDSSCLEGCLCPEYVHADGELVPVNSQSSEGALSLPGPRTCADARGTR